MSAPRALSQLTYIRWKQLDRWPAGTRKSCVLIISAASWRHITPTRRHRDTLFSKSVWARRSSCHASLDRRWSHHLACRTWCGWSPSCNTMQIKIFWGSWAVALDVAVLFSFHEVTKRRTAKKFWLVCLGSVVLQPLQIIQFVYQQ